MKIERFITTKKFIAHFLRLLFPDGESTFIDAFQIEFKLSYFSILQTRVVNDLQLELEILVFFVGTSIHK